MVGITSDELRRIVWDALVRAKGDRAKAAVILGKSVRSLNRYIHDLNLFADMDRAGLIKHAGPPRNVEARDLEAPGVHRGVHQAPRWAD